MRETSTDIDFEANARMMLRQDRFCRWAGMQLVDVGEDHASVSMAVRPEMINAFGVCHGGVTFALADSAFGTAANADGKMALALEVNISYTKKVFTGDQLIARAQRKSDSAKVAVYEVTVTNQKEETVALFRGTVYKTNRSVEEKYQGNYE